MAVAEVAVAEVAVTEVAVTGAVVTGVAVTGVAVIGAEVTGAEVTGVEVTGVVRWRSGFWGVWAIIRGDILTGGDTLIILIILIIRIIRIRSRITIRPRHILTRMLPRQQRSHRLHRSSRHSHRLKHGITATSLPAIILTFPNALLAGGLCLQPHQTSNDHRLE